ncbi:MAG: ABC transporter permease [Deltaproteobacteria bacterium]|nr:ABC transporter permease [Deltaproteobacteria bacterium]
MMALGALRLLGRNLRRTSGAFVLAAVGITVGIAALVFFLGLSSGLRAVVLGRIFRIDRVEIVPREQSVGALAAMFASAPRGIAPEAIVTIEHIEGVRAVYPKLRLLFPHSGRGGRELFGRNIGAGELIADGIDPALVRDELAPGLRFEDDHALSSGRPCASRNACPENERCATEIIGGGESVFPGRCERLIPAVVSPYLLEVFDGAIAPAHNLPPVARALARGATGLELEWDLGRAGLGTASRGTQRRVYARIIGVTSRAIDLGVTVPLSVARRLNTEYVGAAAAQRYTSAIVVLDRPEAAATVTAQARQLGLEIKTDGAEQMGLLVSIVTAVLTLTSAVIVLLAAMSIAQALAARVRAREGEIALLRVSGATRSFVFWLVIGESLVIGLMASLVGILAARGLALAWNRWVGQGLPAFPFKPDDWFVWHPRHLAGAMLFGVTACVLGAVAPALRAARTAPGEVLSRGVG